MLGCSEIYKKDYLLLRSIENCQIKPLVKYNIRIYNAMTLTILYYILLAVDAFQYYQASIVK